MMKIVFLIDRMSGFGGAQRVIANLANAFQRGGHSVCIMLTGNMEKSVYPLESGVEVRCVQESSVNRIRKIRRMRHAIRSYAPDVIISFLTMVNVLTLMAAFGTGIPVVVSERNDPDQCTGEEKLLSRLFYRFSDCVVVQTEKIGDKIRKFYAGGIVVIENPITPHTVEKTDYTLKKKLLAVGRLDCQKNYPFMLRSFRMFLENGRKECVLDIYGTGREKQAIEELAVRLNIEKNVFFKGNVAGMIALEKGYDCYIMTSDYEGMPNALAEAMSVGLPCISVDCDGGGAAALIDSGSNGILVRKGDLEDFVRQMERVYEDAELRKALGEKAKALRERLSEEAVLLKWRRLIQQLVHK